MFLRPADAAVERGTLSRQARRGSQRALTVKGHGPVPAINRADEAAGNGPVACEARARGPFQGQSRGGGRAGKRRLVNALMSNQPTLLHLDTCCQSGYTGCPYSNHKTTHDLQHSSRTGQCQRSGGCAVRAAAGSQRQARDGIGHTCAATAVGKAPELCGRRFVRSSATLWEMITA